LCDATLWRHQCKNLADIAAIRVVDLTGHDSVGALADAVLAAAAARFALAGLSMGGYVALEVMRRAPERVSRLALLDSSARADTPQQSARRRDLIALAGKGRFKGVTPRLLPLFIHPDRLGDAALTGAVTAMAEAVGRDAFVRQQRAVLGRPDGRADLARIACPTLVLCGRQDEPTPLKAHQEMAAAIPRCPAGGDRGLRPPVGPGTAQSGHRRHAPMADGRMTATPLSACPSRPRRCG
jgi:pimeloyl-ACP methyl ester carboxylesterase